MLAGWKLRRRVTASNNCQLAVSAIRWRNRLRRRQGVEICKSCRVIACFADRSYDGPRIVGPREVSRMTVAIRLVITACLLLCACVLSYAQKKDPDPLDRVITELQSGNTAKALAALDDLIKQYPANPDAYF